MLYLGREGHPPPVEIAPLAAIQLGLIDPRPGNAWQRWKMPRPPQWIEMQWNGSRAHLGVPRPAETIEVLRRCLNELQDGQPASNS